MTSVRLNNDIDNKSSLLKDIEKTTKTKIIKKAIAIDYDKQSKQAKIFFKKVQNKMLWAITGKTAAELIQTHSNPELPNMELTSWKGLIVRRQDVGIAKSDLNAFLEFNEQELLPHAGKVKAEIAIRIAEKRYERFDKKREIKEARKADEEDLKEEFENKFLENQKGKNRIGN